MEDKIKEYLKDYFEDLGMSVASTRLSEVAHDIAEIAANEYLNVMSEQNTVMKKLEKENAEWKEFADTRIKEVEELEKENADLKDEIKQWQSSWDCIVKENADLEDKLYRRNKRVEVLEQQLDNVKFFNRDEVEKIFANSKLMYLNGVDYLTEFHKVITAICKLAIPEQKYLSLEEVRHILNETVKEWKIYQDTKEEYPYNSNYVSSQICNLAIKPITRDKIMKVLNKLLYEKRDIDGGICDSFTGNPIKDYVIGLNKIKEKCADEILNDKDSTTTE